ncbi:hypothetical protein PUMCH_002962 [Australozyma saopauloensis]|uniref:C2H2-type domain-containing protein n=1 Tax=Australozyma saopauloensis TaxID=291208 RepID=A0AAX4HAV1_9ASCO|nr:hypothetical protein PUMCH_002962 [[Candida] saopauloensis]
MDSISNWEDLISLKRLGPVSSGPQDEDFSLYFVDKNFDNLFNETLHTLQDLDVPPGYNPADLPPQLHQAVSARHLRQHLNASPYRHSKKPSGTAIFGFLDHNRELSLSGTNADIFRLTKPNETTKSISPTQLARSNPIERLGPPVLMNQNSRLPQPVVAEEKQGGDDIIVTTSNPKSYKFPPLPSPPPTDAFVHTNVPLETIQHPIVGDETYPDEIDEILDIPTDPSRRFVPIPVQYPTAAPIVVNRLPQHVQQQVQRPRPRHCSPSRSPRRASVLYEDTFLVSELEPFSIPEYPEDTSYASYNHSSRVLPVRIRPEPLNLNMNVFMPPPTTSLLSHDSPEPHSPLPQAYSSPIHHKTGITTALSPGVKRAFYNPQFFSDDTDNYYELQPPIMSSSPPRANSIQSSPIRQLKQMTEQNPEDSVSDINETILQLTPLRSQQPMTPSRKKFTLEWSPIISPNGKDGDVKKAIQELSPKRMVKKTSLLPPGELDRYWEGPDANKIFTCTYEGCGKKFTRRYNVRSHIQTHLSDRPFTCSYCPKSFVRQHDLNRHVKSHMVTKNCRCRCGKEFTRVEGYKKHLANGVCSKGYDNGGGISKPGAHRPKQETVLDGLTSNRLNEELGLSLG